MKLNDASFVMPAGWLLYGDTKVQEDRRVIRVKHPAADVRLQLATLTGTQNLEQACSDLVTEQSKEYEQVTKNATLSLGLRTSEAAGVSCGFQGARSSDQLPNRVTFTLVERESDQHLLLIRTTIPEEMPDDSPAPAQAAAMICQASTSFGTPLPLC